MDSPYQIWIFLIFLYQKFSNPVLNFKPWFSVQNNLLTCWVSFVNSQKLFCSRKTSFFMLILNLSCIHIQSLLYFVYFKNKFLLLFIKCITMPQESKYLSDHFNQSFTSLFLLKICHLFLYLVLLRESFFCLFWNGQKCLFWNGQKCLFWNGQKGHNTVYCIMLFLFIKYFFSCFLFWFIVNYWLKMVAFQ